jgi:hypothetical protein
VDYQFFNELPKEIPHGYMCAYIPDSNNTVHSVQRVSGGVAGMDADKQAWLAKYATGPSHDSSLSAPGAQTMDQINAILRDQFGILPKRRAIGYNKPYPNEYDLIPLPPMYHLLEFTKFSGSEGSSAIEHVSQYLVQLGMISVSDPLRVRFFSQSLIGLAFGWYTSLGPDSIRTWKQLEEQFHIQYCRCFTGCPPRGIPKVVGFWIGWRRDQELEGASNTRFRQVRATMCVIPFVLFGGLYCLGC